MARPAPYSIKIRYDSILSLFLAIVMLAPVGIWNRYVFMESNLPFLLIPLITAALIVSSGRIPKGITFPGVAVSFLLLILYAWVRLDNPWDLNVTIINLNPNAIRPGSSYVLDLIIFYFLFIIAAMLFYKRTRFSLCLWFAICGYIIGFVIRNSLDIVALQQGFNLSPGFVLVTLLPFVFLIHGNRNKMAFIPSVLLFFCIMWLGLIGARSAVAALLIFYIMMRAWPMITRSRLMYFSTFWGMVLLIACLTVLYLLYAITVPAGSMLKAPLVEGSDVGVLQKSVGTRVEIWIHLAYLISQQALFGYGTDHLTSVLRPVAFIVFTLPRDNIEAHSLYFELLYRLGAIGLLGFILIMFSIWRVFWSGREQWAVRVAGASLLCLLVYSSTGGFFVFNDLQLRSGFAWIILGIGAGASLRAMKDARRRSSNRQSLWSPLPLTRVGGKPRTG